MSLISLCDSPFPRCLTLDHRHCSTNLLMNYYFKMLADCDELSLSRARIERDEIQALGRKAYRDSAIKMVRIWEDTMDRRHESAILHHEKKHQNSLIHGENGCPRSRSRQCLVPSPDRPKSSEAEQLRASSPSEQWSKLITYLLPSWFCQNRKQSIDCLPALIQL